MKKNSFVSRARALFSKVVSYCLILFIVTCWFSAGANAFFGNKVKTPSLAIIGAGDFSADVIDDQLTGLPEELTARIVERLTNSRRFKVLERKALRKVVQEHRFGAKRPASDMDRLLDKAVKDLEDVQAGTLAVAGILSGNNDVLNDFKDLGNAVGADYLVYAKLEKLQKKSKTTAVPFSTQGKTTTRNLVDARLYLRVIDVKEGQVIGASSFQRKISERAWSGNETKMDLFSIFDELGRQASARILDIVSPPTLIGVDPYVINRGTNDDVKVGDVYVIEREGRELKDASGIKLGRLRTTIGKIKLTRIQETVSSAKLLEGEAAVNDLAVLQVEEAKKTVAATGKNALGPKGAQSKKGLPRIAVGFMKSGSSAQTINANKHIPAATDSIISRLSQTKRFIIIDRQEVDQLLEEQTAQALQENRELPSALGTLEGADYLVYGSLASFSIKERTTKFANSSTNFKSTSKSGLLEGNVRIVDAHSGEVIESCKVSVLEKIDSGDTEARSIALLADAYAEQVVLNLMNAIYPIKVASFVPDGIVYINRGSDGGLFVGETLGAYRLGEQVIDPDTGRQLGAVESFLGEVIVTEVEEARSKAKSPVTLQIGDLLKRSVDNKKMRAGVSKGKKKVFSGANISSGKPSGKATLAVGRFSLSLQGNNQLLAGDMIDRLTSDLFSKLSDTRRFELMERELDQLLGEKAFTAIVQDTDINDSLQQLKGVDYLIFGSINDFYIQTKKKKIASLNKVQITKKGFVEAGLRIVDVHSGQIVAAEKVRINTKLSGKEDNRLQVNKLISKLSDKIVQGIVSKIYPFKVLGVSGDGSIFVNQGKETGLSIGDTFQVMRPGEKLIDLDTGIDFGTAEVQIAKIKLTQIENGRSKAKMLSGNDVRRGDILRKIKAVKGHKASKQVQKVNKPDF